LARELNAARPPAGMDAVRPGDVAQRGLVPGAELPLGRRAGHVVVSHWSAKLMLLDCPVTAWADHVRKLVRERAIGC
jgi:hypothetical protein